LSSTTRRAGAAFAAVLALVVAPGAAASASEGSVPAEVVAYAADPAGLIARLETFVGVGSDGKGISFDDSTAVGQLNRVFVFTPAWLAGEATESPVERLNEWTAPVTIAEKPVGLATIWINADTLLPELSDFERDVDLATQLSDVPADAYLVRDDARGAWFTLEPPSLTPVETGSSGITGPTTLTVYQGLITDRADAPVAPAPPNLGSVLSVATVALAALLVVVVLLVPMLRRRDRAEPMDAAAPDPEQD
jgi:hypothetical protein